MPEGPRLLCDLTHRHSPHFVLLSQALSVRGTHNLWTFATLRKLTIHRTAMAVLMAISLYWPFIMRYNFHLAKPIKSFGLHAVRSWSSSLCNPILFLSLFLTIPQRLVFEPCKGTSGQHQPPCIFQESVDQRLTGRVHDFSNPGKLKFTTWFISNRMTPAASLMDHTVE